MKTYRLNLTLLLLLCGVAVSAQMKKLDKNYKTNKDVVVYVDAKNTDIEVSYWDKNEVQVEAFLEETQVGEKQAQEMLKSWNLSTKATGGEVTITSAGGNNWAPVMPTLEVPLAELPEMMAPLQEMLVPLMENVPIPPLPPKLYDNIGQLEFDYEAYQKQGDKYLEKWEAQIEKNFGKDFEKAMDDWAKRFEQDSVWKRKVIVMEKKMEKDMEAWEKKYGKDMEIWAKEHSKAMEKWGEDFGKKMEVWGSQFEHAPEHPNQKGKVYVFNRMNDRGSKKTIRIKMPKDGQLSLDVRYGKVDLQGSTKNLKASLTHSNFNAQTITGNETELKAAYTPVKVQDWNYGILDASYSPSLELNRVRSIKLSSNSSDVDIKEVVHDGIFRGSFGELVISKLHPDFQSLDIALENSDLKLDLPESAYHLNYNGTKSEVVFPQGLQLKSSTSYDTQKYKGYNKDRTADGTVTIHANFSDILLK